MEKKQLTREEELKRRKKILRERSAKIYFKITLIFLLFMAVACGFLIFQPDREYSASENRMLAQKPEFSLANLASGKFMTDMEDYVTDQFFFRDQWISLKVLEDMALGKRESNGVYIGKQGYLMQVPENNPKYNSDPDAYSEKRPGCYRKDERNCKIHIRCILSFLSYSITS